MGGVTTSCCRTNVEPLSNRTWEPPSCAGDVTGSQRLENTHGAAHTHSTAKFLPTVTFCPNFLVLQTQDSVERASRGRESTHTTQIWLIWQSMLICANNMRASCFFSPSSRSVTYVALLKYCRRPLEGSEEACESAFGALVRYTFTGM